MPKELLKKAKVVAVVAVQVHLNAAVVSAVAIVKVAVTDQNLPAKI
jgi:hypothetical protein